ncbi:hypothetical protein SAMN05660776_0939 [Salegentibacter holothuriorum]|uniref:Uncharacterized protein n=1 Tax=Salegentibacter holothuriorum TaxID=241145 RepID=A0A1T5AXU5_9FLAO|nr:hypothetical protein [Salegentibacter holothuriorum]SKB39580.1 hypothetical protein SAMN05660776_0939 [Salegentibacter holothuriorum]
MNDFIAIKDIKQVFEENLFPGITLWNRLEARPRADDFDSAIKAEIRDPLWMLTKQWQMGEFRGDDAGSPAFAKVQVATTSITKYQAGKNAVQNYDDEVPLEAKVEQKKLSFEQAGRKTAMDIRLLMGREWLKLTKQGFENLRQKYIELYSFEIPDPEDKTQATTVAHPEAWQLSLAIAGRSVDGYALYEYLKKNANNKASDNTPDAGNANLDKLGEKFIDWYERLFLQPEAEKNNAWIPPRMEYSFAVSAPAGSTEKIMAAEEYYHGHLDWYNLNIASQSRKLEINETENPTQEVQNRETLSFFPVPVSFDGMPDTRWWKFEDGNVNFGDIKPDTTDVNKLLFLEFGLIYANDWFVVPLTLPAGSIAEIKGLSVTNVFGEKLWIEAAGKGLDDDWKRWNMFALSQKGEQQEPADNSLLILPTVEKIQQGKPLEEVFFLRDEVANMVWAIEKKIPLPTGSTKQGAEAADELHDYYQKILDRSIISSSVQEFNPEYQAKIRYEIMNSVPENWIPFIPVHLSGNNREIQLQRASMPRILKNADPGQAEKVKPRTQLLREGLDQHPVEAYMLYEEEVPRAGLQVHQNFQRARWYNGKVINWFGSGKQTGRGQGHSGLAFDRIVDVKKTD